MQLLLHNKKCIVTGASQGLGRAIAILLAAEQCDLVLVARRKKPLEEVKKFIQKKYNCNVVTLSIDVTSKNADIKIKDFALKQLGTIDVLINSSVDSRQRRTTGWRRP